MKKLSPEVRKILLKIYIGQNVRKEGILQSEIYSKDNVQRLITQGLIRENHWHLDQFLTTEKGSRLARGIVNKRIEANKYKLRKNTDKIPDRVLSFFINRYVSKNLAFSTNRDHYEVRADYSKSWEDSILVDGRMWILWNEFFESLRSLWLCVKTHHYVSTRGGETRDFHYVISLEVRNFLVGEFGISDFSSEEERTLRLYSFLLSAKKILATDDVEGARQRYYESLKAFQVTEDQVAGIVNEMNKQEITSKYRGLLSEWKPFDIMTLTKYGIYLSSNIIDPATKALLDGKGAIKQYAVEEEIPTLREVKSELGILDRKELGDFYVLVSLFERQLRDFIREKLGKGWKKRIKNDVPNVYQSWEEKRNRDTRWGIQPEEELVSYSNLGDYISIVKKYPRIFSDGIEDLGDIITHLKMWYNHGRNPIMHSRTVDKQKFYTTKSAVDFLSEWMRRKS